MIIRFNEEKIKQRLIQLSKEARVIFAASSAERLFPVLVKLNNVMRSSDISLLRNILDRLWDSLSGNYEYTIEMQATDLEKCMSLIPDEGRDVFAESALIEDAVACIAYGLRANINGDVQEAIWAARRVYEAVDNYILTIMSRDGQISVNEDSVIDHPIAQNELKRQERDLTELEGTMDSKKLVALVNIFKLRSQKENVLPNN